MSDKPYISIYYTNHLWRELSICFIVINLFQKGRTFNDLTFFIGYKTIIQRSFDVHEMRILGSMY